jgi:hypothetical protein
MAVAFQRTLDHASPGSRFLVDIGDSCFAGVHVPTDDLLIGVAIKNGWQYGSTKLLRKRRSYDGSQLRQVLLEFSAP